MEAEKSESISLQDKDEETKAWRVYTAYLRPNPAKGWSQTPAYSIQGRPGCQEISSMLSAASRLTAALLVLVVRSLQVARVL